MTTMTTMTAQAYPTKPPLQLALNDLPPRRVVRFLHPAVLSADEFFSLDANDPGGLHHGVAHTA